jgi:hypothetical protein
MLSEASSKELAESKDPYRTRHSRLAYRDPSTPQEGSRCSPSRWGQDNSSLLMTVRACGPSNKQRGYFALRLALREGGTTPFSGRSRSILSESLCSG